ncbi:RNA-directed DNA polymerase, eukaryota, reverse transcriptase zinc-binding domain protein [Tanacetum coccineum]
MIFKFIFTLNLSFRDILAKAVDNIDIEIEKNLCFVPTGQNDSGDKVDPSVNIEKVDPCKIHVWSRMINVPLEAWSPRGINTLASRLGRPMMMDSTTALMCHKGIGRIGYARVLMEMDAKKGWQAMNRGDEDYDEEVDIIDELDQQKYIVRDWAWLILGDFNVTMNATEHSSGGSLTISDMQEFKYIMNKLELDDICSSGFHFTWTKSLRNPNCNVLKKLERMMVIEEFMQKFLRAYYVFLPYLICGHNPVELIVKEGVPKKQKSLRFSNFIAEKLKTIQERVDKNHHDKKIKEEVVLLVKEYFDASNDELSFQKHKTRVKWLKEGDKNTTYFHGILKARRHKNRVERKTKPVVPVINGIFRNTLSSDEAMTIVREVSDKEIKEALFEIDSDKASGHDGYSS